MVGGAGLALLAIVLVAVGNDGDGESTVSESARTSPLEVCVEDIQGLMSEQARRDNEGDQGATAIFHRYGSEDVRSSVLVQIYARFQGEATSEGLDRARALAVERIVDYCMKYELGSSQGGTPAPPTDPRTTSTAPPSENFGNPPDWEPVD